MFESCSNMNEPKYCKSCGAYIHDRFKKCLACGFPVEVPSLGGNPNCVETTTLAGCYAFLLEQRIKERCDGNKSKTEKVDIDLDDLMEKTFYTVKYGAEISEYYLVDRPKIARFPKDALESGRTIDGRIICGATDGVKHVINLQLIEK